MCFCIKFRVKIRKIREGSLLAAELLLFVMAYCEHEITVRAQLKKNYVSIQYDLVRERRILQKKFFYSYSDIFSKKVDFLMWKNEVFRQKKQKDLSEKKFLRSRTSYCKYKQPLHISN